MKPGDLVHLTGSNVSTTLFSVLELNARHCGRAWSGDVCLVVAASHGYVMVLTPRRELGWVIGLVFGGSHATG